MRGWNPAPDRGSAVGGAVTIEKLYSPLEFCLHDPREEEENGEYGMYDFNDERYKIPHNEAWEHMNAIELTLRRECDNLDKTHGLAEYLPNGLREKVWSLFPSIERCGDSLYFAASVELTAPLSPEELAELKERWSGQLSDGFGEGLEQREIKVGREELYIVPWTSDAGFFVETEREFFRRLGLETPESRTLMERLAAKLDAELADYQAKLAEKSKEDIIGMAFQAASMSDTRLLLGKELTLTDAQVEALLEADLPLSEVAEVLRGSFYESVGVLDAGSLLEGAHISVPQAPAQAALREQANESKRKGYLIAVSDGDGYIPDAAHIERDDSLNIYPNDCAAAEAAEADGVKLIYGLPHIPNGLYLDTPENRALAERVSEQTRLVMPAEGELKRRLFEELDDGFAMYRNTVLAFDKERLFNDAGKIAASRAVYEYFRHEHPYTVMQAEFLLKFHNPLEVIHDRCDVGSGKAKCEPEAVFADPEKAFKEFTLSEDTSAEPLQEPHSFREWRERWREESKSRATPKKEPGHNKRDPDL
jgi:hypothetical protein